MYIYAKIRGLLNNSTNDNEKELLIKVAQGNESAFTRLFYAYHNKLGAYIYVLSRNHTLNYLRKIARENVFHYCIKTKTLHENRKK